MTIFGTLNYAPKYRQIHQIRYLGRIFECAEECGQKKTGLCGKNSQTGGGGGGGGDGDGDGDSNTGDDEPKSLH